MSPQTNGVLGTTTHPQPSLEAIELIPFTGPSDGPASSTTLSVACRALLTMVTCARNVRAISSPQSPAAPGGFGFGF